MTERGDTFEPFPLQRRGTADYMRVAAGRSNVHGLVELDVTEAGHGLGTGTGDG